jgi:hypothetical protein
MNAKSPAMASNLNKLDEHEITADEYEEIPELTEEDFARPDLVWRVAGEVVSASEGKAAFRNALKKNCARIDWFAIPRLFLSS